MEVRIWPKYQIEALYKAEENPVFETSIGSFDDICETKVRCFRCGKKVRRSNCGSWALSRQLDVYVCSSCGIDEALRSVSGTHLPLLNWDVVSRPEIHHEEVSDAVTLTPVCGFPDLLSGAADEREVCHMRAYYDGETWVQDWIPGKRFQKSYIADVKEFASSFLLYPDMADEYSMRRLFPVAEATSDSSEVNLYSERDSFYVRIRLIAKSKDFSVYLYFYEK